MGVQSRQNARRVAAIPPFYVMEIVRRAQHLEATGRDVIHLEVGEPDFPTPPDVVSAAEAAMRAGHTRYTESQGILALRKAIAAQYHERHGVCVDPGRIQLTAGASGALLLAASVCLDPGDGLLMADPGYPCNPWFAKTVGAEVHRLTTTAASAFHPTRAQCAAEATAKDRALLLAHPANPTGLSVPQQTLQDLLAWSEETGRAAIVDEIYGELVFTQTHRSSLVYGDTHWVIGSFSKTFNMTGWRLGWVIVPEASVDAATKLAQHLFISPPSVAQYAALGCFTPDTSALVKARHAELADRRDRLVPALQALGFDIPAVPEGAFYVFADARRWTDDSRAWCLQVLEDAGVAMTPGIDFSDRLAPTWVRIAYTQPWPRLEEALARLSERLS